MKMGDSLRPMLSQISNDLVSAFVGSVFVDLRDLFSDYGYWDKDRDYLLSRIEKEGLVVMTQSLPLLGKAVDTALVTLQALNVPAGFSLCPNTRLPRFMKYFFSKFFMDDGTPIYKLPPLLGDSEWSGYGFSELTDVEHLRALRQVLLAFAKVKIPCDPRVEAQAIEQFRARVTVVPCRYDKDVVRRASALLNKVFSRARGPQSAFSKWVNNPIGRHGPGAVAEGEKGCEKWDFRYWKGLDPLLYKWRKELPDPKRSDPGSARLCCVPKDFRGPRIICIEPKENQFAQQGIMELLYTFIGRHPITRRSISFRDQSQSQAMCHNLNNVTIDLKDASDNLKLSLVRLMFPKWLFSLTTRYRSRLLRIGTQAIAPTCFASMGSAVCFPVETLVFWAIAQSTSDFYGVRKPVRVFGDDIIVDRKVAYEVIRALAAVGLPYNPAKTCILTPVRESCGEWTWYRKSCVITQFKAGRICDFRSWLAGMQYASQLRKACYFSTAKALLSLCDRIYPVPYTWLGYTDAIDRSKYRWSKGLHRLEVKAPVLFRARCRQPVSDYARLYAWFVGNDQEPASSGPERVKLRWIPVSSFDEHR